jgi:hypothetical protein
LDQEETVSEDSIDVATMSPLGYSLVCVGVLDTILSCADSCRKIGSPSKNMKVYQRDVNAEMCDTLERPRSFETKRWSLAEKAK